MSNCPISVGQNDDGLTVEKFINKTYDSSSKNRKKALSDLCPCKVKEDFPVVWERIISMTEDESGEVREQALHNLGDGSPRHMEERVMQVVEKLYNDPDLKVRKKARKMCISYRKTGKWNVL